MAYTPTVWETGDIITAEKLNNIEEGIAAAGAYIVPIVMDSETNLYILQASFDDISAAVSAGRLVMAKFSTSDTDFGLRFLYAVSYMADQDKPYQVFFFNSDGTEFYNAANSTDNLVQVAE